MQCTASDIPKAALTVARNKLAWTGYFDETFYVASSGAFAEPSADSSLFEAQTVENVASAEICVYVAKTCKLDESRSEVGVLFLCAHGAGMSALSYASATKRILTMMHQQAPNIPCQVLAFDYRGHGASGGAPEDVSSATCAADAVHVLAEAIERAGACNPRVHWNVVLVGHSMGAGIATRVCHYLHGLERLQYPVCFSVTALAILDVLETTALESLARMPEVLMSRPPSFRTAQEAQAYAYKARMTRIKRLNPSIALLDQLVQLHDPEEEPPAAATAAAAAGHTASSKKRFAWRTDLARTKAHWVSWFSGLLKGFTTSPCAGRLMILSEYTTLDKETTIAQMQGKFQLVTLEGGHAIHEDCADQVACLLVDTALRYTTCSPSLVGATALQELEQRNRDEQNPKKRYAKPSPSTLAPTAANHYSPWLSSKTNGQHPPRHPHVQMQMQMPTPTPTPTPMPMPPSPLRASLPRLAGDTIKEEDDDDDA